MPRTITETADPNQLQIRARVMEPDGESTLVERAHVEVLVVYTRSDDPTKPRGETVIFKIADTGPEVEGAIKLTEAQAPGGGDAQNQFSAAERNTLVQALAKLKNLGEELLGF